MTLTLIHPTKSQSGISALMVDDAYAYPPYKIPVWQFCIMVDDAYAYPPYKIPIWHFCINGG
ncbi:UNVERIFIED_ORG: hypothetical protein J2Y78_001272 [Buttiauxella agrestis ATCC 33320]